MSFRTPRLAVTAVFFFNGGLFGAWASRIPALKDRFDLQPDTLGLFLLLLAGGAILSFPLAGRLADRLGAAVVTKGLLISYPLAFAAIGVAPELWLFGFAIFAFGVTHGAMDVTMNTWGAEVEARFGRSIMPSLHAMFSVGAGVGAASGVLAAALSWETGAHFIAFGVFVVVLAAPFALVAWQSDPPQETASGSLFPLPSGPLLLAGILAFCAALGEGAMVDWSAVYLVAVVSASETQAALGFTVFSIAIVAVRFSGEWLIPKLGRERAGRLSGLVACIGAVTAVTGVGLVPVLVGFALMGAGYALVMPLVFSRAAEQDGGAGANIARVATLSYGGMLLGPPIIGFIAEAAGFQTAFGLVALLAAVIFVFGGALRSRN